MDSESPFKNKLHNITYTYDKQILNLEINITFHKIKLHTKELNLNRLMIINKSFTVFRTIFFEYQSDYKVRLTAINENRYNKKLRSLTVSTTSSPSATNIVNLTDSPIPIEVKTILSYGTKFALRIDKLGPAQLFRLIADIEFILNTLEDINLRNNIRCDLVNVMSNFINRPPHNSTSSQKYLSQCYKISKSYFTTNENLIVLEADKSN